MPYQTKAQWEPVINVVEERMGLGRRIIASVEYGKAIAKYLQEDGVQYEANMTQAQINALKQDFIAKMTEARDALNAALA